MNKNIKEVTASSPAPVGGWDPLDSRGRLLSQLDGATGNLTTDQQRVYADMPSEEYSPQPSTSNKVVQSHDGSAELHQLVASNDVWKDPVTDTIRVNAAVRA